MGRDSGYLALVSSVTSGAEICIIPELEFDKKSTKNRLLKELNDGRLYILAVVAEGSKSTKMLRDWIVEELNMSCRVTILGHVQRGGSPTVYDRLMAMNMVKLSIDTLLEHSKDYYICLRDGTLICEEIASLDGIKNQNIQKYISMIN
jgi:6-phosphofructokinase 1